MTAGRAAAKCCSATIATANPQCQVLLEFAGSAHQGCLCQVHAAIVQAMGQLQRRIVHRIVLPPLEETADAAHPSTGSRLSKCHRCVFQVAARVYVCRLTWSHIVRRNHQAMKGNGKFVSEDRMCIINHDWPWAAR